MKHISTLLPLLCWSLFAVPLSGLAAQNFKSVGSYSFSVSTQAPQARPMLLVQNQNEEAQAPVQGPQPGTLVLPAAVENQNLNEKTEKQCMTVCARWGEECTFINRGIGGMSKKCRRACKQFTEECF